MTTVRDLYEWAVENHVEDLPIGLLYQDDDKELGGDTFAKEDMRDLNIDISRNRDIDYVLLG